MSKKKRNLKSAICKGGHLQTSILENNETYELKHCRECSEAIIDTCSHCDTAILGGYVHDKIIPVPIFFDGNSSTSIPTREVKNENDIIPNYCHECGKPYPWTEKFLSDYKLILELETEDLDKAIQDNIYKATEEALKQKFTGNSVMILGLRLKKLAPSVKNTMLSILTNVASTEVIKQLSQTT